MKYFGVLFKLLLLVLIASTTCDETFDNTAVEATSAPIHAAIAAIELKAGEHVNYKQRQLIETSRHLKTDPCDNFLYYACGNWPYFMESDILDTLHVLDAKMNVEIGDIFENRDPTARVPNFMGEAHNYYESCVAIGREKHNPLEYLQWLEINESLTWPAFANKYSPINWLQVLAILRKYGLNNLIIHEEAIQHPLNNTKMVMAIQRPFADSPFHYLGPLEDEHRKFTLWNISDRLDHSMFVDLDLALKEVVDRYEDADDVGPQLITLDQLNDLQLEWLRRYLVIALLPAHLEPQMEVYIQDVEYLRAIKLVLDKIEEFNRYLLPQYLLLNFLSHTTNRLSDPGYYGCTTSTRLLFPLVMQWLHKNRHPAVSESFYNIQLLFSNLKHFLRGRMTSDMPGLDSSLAEYFGHKLDNLKLHILDVWQPSLEAFYGGLRLEPSDYFGNRLKLRQQHFRSTHSHLWDYVERGALEFLDREIVDIADSLQPYLVSRQSLVVLPVTTLQFPLYHPQYNETLVYSSLGFMLAREIAKSFDADNLEIDANGNLNSEFVEVFNATTTSSEKGDDASGQEIVNAIALELAYEAFRKLHPVAEDEANLFLLNYAQMYCSNYIKFGDHLPIVNTVVQQFLTVWNVFGCENEEAAVFA